MASASQHFYLFFRSYKEETDHLNWFLPILSQNCTVLNREISLLLFSCLIIILSFVEHQAITRKMPFLTVKSVFALPDAKLALVLLTKQVFTSQGEFLQIRRKNVEYFNLVHSHRPKFGLFCYCRQKFLSCPFPFVFSGPFTAPFIFLLAAVKPLALIMG